MEQNSKPIIRFRGFDAPWISSELNNISSINPKTTIPDSFEYVDLESVVGTSLLGHRTEKKESAPSRAQRRASKGDIFFQTVRPYQRNNFLFDMDDKNFVFSTGYAQIRSEMYSYFLFNALQRDPFLKEVLNNCTGTSFPAINANALGKIRVSYPNDVSEQERIGDTLTNLDSTINYRRHELEKLENVKKACMERMFPREGETTPQLRFKGFNDDWQLVRLGDIGSFKSNGVDKKISDNETVINLLNYMDVYNKRRLTARNCGSLMQVTASSRQIQENNVERGDVFFTPSSETAEDIGHVLVIEETLPNTCYSYHLMRFRPESEAFYLNFPNYVLESDYVRSQLVLSAQGVQRFVLRKENFENINCFIPTLAEQEKIGNYFRHLDELIAAKRQEIEKLQNIKQSLLDKMFV